MEKIKSVARKVWDAICNFCKRTWTAVRGLWVRRNETVNPTVGWAVYGGVLVLAIVLALIIWL